MNRIKELRLKNGWLQSDLAEKLHVNRQTIGNYETETRGLDVETIFKLCDIFGVTADYLLGRSDMPSPAIAPEEWQLLAAFRRADDRAKAMVALALEPWAQAQESVS